MFRVDAGPAPRYLAAYAVRTDDPAQRRIWYFPTVAGITPTVSSGAGATVLPQGVAIGDEHLPGDYRVTVILSSRPLRRHEVDARPRDEEGGTFVLRLRVTADPR